jgi:hypothetical protein
MADKTTDQTGCYVPDPKYTFLFDPPSASKPLLCVICTESRLTLPAGSRRGEHRPGGEAARDSDPAMLPCGHVFGSACLAVWLAAHDMCPACRFVLQYELCWHPIAPRRLTRENLLFSPATLPDGGEVGPQCGPCLRQTDQQVALELGVPLAQAYYECKRRYEETGSAADRRRMELAKEELDKTMKLLTPSEGRRW